MALAYLGWKGFPGCGTIFVKTRKLPSKPERVGQAIGDMGAVPGFSMTLGEHHELFFFPFLDSGDK